MTALKLHNFYPAIRPESRLLDRFAGLVAQGSEGRVTVDVAHGNALDLDDAKGLEWLAQGRADLAILWPVFLQQGCAELQASYIMGSARDLHDHQRAITVLEEIDRTVLSDAGVESIAMWPSPVLQISIFSKGQAVRTLADLAGRRLRVFSRDLEPTFRRLGADAEFIPQGELYGALEAGRFDSTVYPACHTAWSVPLWRVTQHAAYLFPEALHPYLLCASPQAWSRLDDAGRALLQAAAARVHADFLRLSVDDSAERAARHNLQIAGLQWHADFPAADQARFADSALRTWRELSEAAGPRARANFQRLLSATGRTATVAPIPASG
jgi:TRAP-type transport system periplasmic protein